MYGLNYWETVEDKWTFPTTVEDELISALPLSTHSAVEMLHDSALYKFMIDIDIDICCDALTSIEFSFDPCNIYRGRDRPRGVG